MAIEISEGAAAAAMLIPTMQLKINSKTLIQALKKVHTILQDENKVHMSPLERAQYLEWFDPNTINKTVKKKNKDARLTAIVHGYSSALAVKKWFLSSQHKELDDKVSDGNVYLTGGSWHPDIKFLQVNVNNWADYNSSDLVIIKGKCYYGVSLKKKAKSSSANPPMINKSVVALLKDLGKGDVADKLYRSRIKYFGGIVAAASNAGKPLAGSTGITAKKAFHTKIKHPKPDKNEWINLIDLKGPAKLKLGNVPLQKVKDGDEVNEIYQYYINSIGKGGVIVCSGTPATKAATKTILAHEKIKHLFAMGPDYEKKQNLWDMRKLVNSKLVTFKGPGGFYSDILKIMNGKGIPEKIGGYLISAVLKTELKDATGVLLKKGHHFGFALVTALGEVKKGKMNSESVQHAIVKNNPTIQAKIGEMERALKSDKWRIIIDENETDDVHEAAKKKGNSPPAKLFFVLGLGGKGNELDEKVLDFQIRYKGSFSPSPQFLGGMTEDFEKALESKDTHVDYNFAKACR